MEITIQDRNTIGPSTIGYLDLTGRTFALFGVENLSWLAKTGRTRSFQYVDRKGMAEPYDPPSWWFLVRGDSIYGGAGSSFPCE